MPPVFSLVSFRFLIPIPSAISSLCRSVWLVFIMTRLNFVEGSDEFCIAGLAMGERHVSDSSHEHDRRACDEVRSELGFSMLESTYERAMMIELKKAGFPAERQVTLRC